MRRIPRPPLRETIAGLALLAGLVVIMLTIGNLAQQITGLHSQYDSLHAEYEGLYEEAIVEGVNPQAPAPDDVPEAQTPRLPGAEPPDPIGPSDGQVLAALGKFCTVNDCTPRPTATQVAEALADHCVANRCRGEDGDDSTVPGPGATSEQIAAQVALFCADGACRGEDGDDAPPVTAEQLQAEVVRYCDARNECRGEPGSNGSNGSDGRGIAKAECHTTGDWIFTYTDGTAQTVAGPCRVVQPTPTPTPSASTTKGR